MFTTDFFIIVCPKTEFADFIFPVVPISNSVIDDI